MDKQEPGILLPPAADVPQLYLDGWCDGQAYLLANTRANRPAEDKQEPVAKFKVGDPVQRAEPRSYLFPGIVIGANLKLDGKTWLYSVECIAPGVEGMVHEFTERALEARANRPADDGLVARLEELERLMSDISEDCWCAGWLHGNEHALFRKVFLGDPPRYGMGEVRQVDLDRLKFLAGSTGCWIEWRRDDGPVPIALADFAQGIAAPSGGETGTGSTEGKSPVPAGNAPEGGIHDPSR